MAFVVRSYAELSQRALETKQDRELAFWYLAKSRDQQGRGRTVKWAFLRAIQLLGCFEWGGRPMSQARFDKIVERGEGVFWHSAGDYLYLHSWDRVCRSLAVVPGDVVGLPLEAFKTLRTFRAHCGYGSAIGWDRTASRAYLSELTGVSKMTQNDYDPIVHTKKQSNIGYHRCSSHKEARRLLDWLNENDGNGATNRRAWLWKDGLTVMVRMPNTYSVELPRLPSGRARRIANEMQADCLLQSSARDHSYPLASALVRRRYCQTDQQARRLFKRDKLASEYFVKTGKHLRLNGEDHRLWVYGHAFQDTNREQRASC